MPLLSSSASTADPNSADAARDDGEFPTTWHRDTYVANVQRDLQGARVRHDQAAEKLNLAELARLGVKAAR